MLQPCMCSVAFAKDLPHFAVTEQVSMEAQPRGRHPLRSCASDRVSDRRCTNVIEHPSTIPWEVPCTFVGPMTELELVMRPRSMVIKSRSTKALYDR